MLPHILESVTQKKILEAQKLLKIKAVARGAEGGNEPTCFLCALTVFCWVPLSCGCASNVPVHSGCVSVSLHFLLHGF